MRSISLTIAINCNSASRLIYRLVFAGARAESKEMIDDVIAEHNDSISCESTNGCSSGLLNLLRWSYLQLKM